MQIESVPPRRHLAPLLKLALELGPLVIFFLGNAYAERFGVAPDQKLFVATGVFIAATVVALAVHFVLVRRLPIMPMVSGVVVVVFGGLTLALQDKTFIMVKPTIVNTLFGRCCSAASPSASRCCRWCSIRCSRSPRRAGAS